ncbi:P-loop containing nucleoside triphosphate hydrolase protein [Catenaria anguillulae PL171]|uniref:p-loop containing nucleoside triphosphate hydrolase protein n=1 Tax=Catenaria anguillulae PL171 TaxID=765915 RepID=A0A1Y2HL89_9FUNG|nr:P-loop containing nucleoside triphosphate hydrolase protein [Catenaria anguillulae PL171]
MDPNLYDEFGNFLGSWSDDEDDNDDLAAPAPASAPAPSFPDTDHEDRMDTDDAPPSSSSMAIIPHEEKEYYPSASQVFGDDVEVLVQEEDAQPLSEPIIAPVQTRSFTKGLAESLDLPALAYSPQFLFDLSHHPGLTRTLAIVGALHHGKTALVDMLIDQTHPEIRWDLEKFNRYTDTHPLERDRGLSIKTGPMSLVLPSLSGKHYLMHLLDTPGHVDFVDEVVCSLQLADGALLVVDAVEGLVANTERILRKLVADKIPFALVINKVDRLILELRLPPLDAYFKLRQVIEEVNSFVGGLVANDKEMADKWRVSPERNNVAFASAEFGFCFTLKSFAWLYADTHRGVDANRLAPRLWGDVAYNPETRKFQRHTSDSGLPRSFLYFILEPLYKLFSITIGESADHIKESLASVDIKLKQSELAMDISPLLRLVLTRFFGKAVGLVDMLAASIPSAEDNASAWVRRTYAGASTDDLYAAMAKGDPQAPLVMHVGKLYPRAINSIAGGSSSDGSDDAGIGLAKGTTVAFDALARVVCGQVRPGMPVHVLGEKYSMDDQEDAAKATVGSVGVFNSRYTIPVAGDAAMGPGNLVLISGIEATVLKTATVVAPEALGKVTIFQPPRHLTEPIVKIALEPVNPSELPKMLAGLRHINRAYPLAVTKVMESGEHVLQGPGELYLDCVMHDLRNHFAEISIKVSDPVTTFAETIVETSALKCFAESPNKKNKLTMIAEPLPGNLVDAIASRDLSTTTMTARELSKKLQVDFGWDVLASRNVWAFGPEDREANVLVDDTLTGETDKTLLKHVRESVVRGFTWGTRDGPLCDEPMRNVKFRLLEAHIADHPMHRAGGQIIPTARRLVHSSFLMASPRLLEPIYAVDVQTPADAVSAVYAVLARRRGHVLSDTPKPGSPLSTVKALIPAMDAFGFETDLRTHTQGMAFPQLYFDHYQLVPGDPLDKSIVLRPLEPAPAQALARDFMVKTRRRKGLAEDVSVAQLFDDPMLLELARQELGHLHIL